MNKKIIVNARYKLRHISGVERCAQEVVSRWGGQAKLVQPPGWAVGVKGHLWEQLALPFHLGQADVLWSPANCGPVLVSSQVLTLHDVSVLEHPEWFSSSFRVWYRYLLPRSVRRVRAIITDSEFSRQRILDLIDLEGQSVKVIYPGVDRAFFHPRSPEDIQAVLAKYRLHPSYILSVGSLEPRKNYSRLLQSWRSLAEKYPDWNLVIVGRNRDQFRPPDLSGRLDNVRILENVSDEELVCLYSGAVCSVFPSLYEGFGLPLLEAMACGAPVVASRIPAFKEVIGQAGLFVDPVDVDAIAGAIENLIQDIGLRKRFRDLGFERAAQFSWEQAAEAIWEICNTV